MRKIHRAALSLVSCRYECNSSVHPRIPQPMESALADLLLPESNALGMEHTIRSRSPLLHTRLTDWAQTVDEFECSFRPCVW